MSTIYDYILQNFTDEIVLDDIARQAHISPSGFCRYFKARTKRTLKEFVNDLRVNYACQLLEENQHNITQICFKAGFNNISNFNRSEEHTSELQSLMRISYAVFCLKKKTTHTNK